MIRAILFDLDNTILDTKSLGDRILDPVLTPLMRSNLPDEVKRGASEALWHTAYEDVFTQFNIPAGIAEEMRVEARKLTIPEDTIIRSYGDEGEIAKLPVKKFLVTTGFTAFQLSKIQKLGIGNLFDGVVIDQVDDLSKRKKKKEIFSELMHVHGWSPEEILVVGDNPRSELGAAKELGVTAVQMLRPGVERWEWAQYHISHFSELAPLLK